MKTRHLLAALAIAGILTASCGSDTATTTTTTAAPTTTEATTTTVAPTTTTTAPAPALTIGDLVGSWKATAHVFTSPAGETFDLVANGGETRTTVLDNGGARTWVTIGDFNDEWDAQLSFSDGLLISTPVEAERGVGTWEVTIEGSVLTMSRADSSFDFTLTGADPTEASETIVFARN